VPNGKQPYDTFKKRAEFMKQSMRLHVLAALSIGFLSTSVSWGQAPTLTFPPTVGVQITSQNLNPLTDVSFLTVQLFNITGTYSVSNGTYLGWCIDDPDSFVFEVPATKPLTSSYDPAASTLYPLVPWAKVNYILNHKQGTFEDVQEAIWNLIFPSNPGHFAVTTAVTNMVTAANANGNFIPGPGGVVAVIVTLDGPSGPNTLQDYIFEVPLPITNQNVPPPPSLTCGGIATTTGIVGTAYSAQIGETGGTPAFTYALNSGTLPQSLTLNTTSGVISGTPLVAGSFPFTVKVTDSTGLTAVSPGCNISITSTHTTGPYTTFTQGGWGAPPHGGNPGALLTADFSLVFPGGSVSIGSGSKVVTFTSAAAIIAFLPAGGTPGTLTTSATNPTSTAAGVFAGQLLAATLSVDFSTAGITRIGLTNLKVKSGALAGYTVQQVLALANQVIAGDYTNMPAGLTVSGLSDVLNSINNNYDNGTQNQGYLQ
jgi:hypothetical protein